MTDSILELLLRAFFHASTVGVLATLISESKILQPVRHHLNYSVLYCPICLGFWIALPVLAIYGPLQYGATVAFSNLWMLIILKTYEALDKTYEDEDG